MPAVIDCQERSQLDIMKEGSMLYLPYKNPPHLLVSPQMRDNLNVEEVFAVRDADQDGGSDD